MDEWWCWFVCLGSFFLQALAFGLHNNFGVFLNVWLGKYGKSNAETAWIGSMAFGIMFIFSPISSYILKREGCRVGVTISAICCITALLASSFVENLYLLYFTYSVFLGVGTSIANIASLLALPIFFDKHLSLATGLATSGSGLSSFAIGPIITTLLERYSISFTLRVLFVLPLLCVFSLLPYSLAKRQVLRRRYQNSEGSFSRSMSSATQSSTASEKLEAEEAVDKDLAEIEVDIAKDVLKLRQEFQPIMTMARSQEILCQELSGSRTNLNVPKLFHVGSSSKSLNTQQSICYELKNGKTLGGSLNDFIGPQYLCDPPSYSSVAGYDLEVGNLKSELIPEEVFREEIDNNAERQSLPSDDGGMFDKNLWGSRKFVLFLVGLMIFMFGYFLPFIFMNRLAVIQGNDPTKAALLMGYLSVANIIGRISFGFLCSVQKRVSRFTMWIAVVVVLAGSTFVLPSLQSYTSYTIYACVFGLFDGCFAGQLSPVLHDILPDKSKIGTGLGIMFASFSLPVLAGPTIAGVMYDLTQSIALSFYIVGGFSIIAVGLLVMSRVYKQDCKTKSIDLKKQKVIEVSFLDGTTHQNHRTFFTRKQNYMQAAIEEL